MEDLAHIVTFARVVNAGSFAGAARHLKVTRSVASKHVAKLEQSLGVQLLNRNTRKLSLTEAGAAYFEHCTRIVEEVESSRRALSQLQAVPKGLLRVTAPVPVATMLGPMLQEFLQRHPQIQLEFDASNRVVDLAAEGYDVAIRAARSLPSRHVVARLLRSMGLHLCASPEYLRRAGTPRHPRDLARHDCLTLPPDLQFKVWPFVRGRERVEVAARGTRQSNMVEALHDWVRAGAGVTLLPGSLIGKDLKDGRLVALLPDWEVETRINLYAVWLPTRHLAPKVRVFVDFMVERFAATP